MIDPVSVGVSDLAAADRFYTAALSALGYRRVEARAAAIGFGKRYTEFWINARPGMTALPSGHGAHVALRTRSTEAVDAFHAAALAHGGTSEGAPGLRPHDGLEGYYAAFIRDADGNRIEAVTFVPVAA